MRTELWLSQLQRERGKGAAAVGRYKDLISVHLSSDVLSEIEKDTHRTFPGHQWLKSRAGQLAMLRVLRAYAALDPEVGYSQGMNFIAGLMLTYLDESDAFGALAFVMQDRGLRDLYKPDGMAFLQVRLWQLGKLMPPRLAAHLECHAVLPVLYASGWLLTCFAADFPLSFASRVMDLVMTDCYAAPLMKVAVHILERCSDALLKMSDMEDMVNLLRQEVPRWPRAALQDFLTEALSRPWSSRQLAVLQEINGAESVCEAVTRVDTAISAATPGIKLPASATTISQDGELPAVERPGAISPSTPPTPRTAARLVALPPPPTSRADKVDWSKWGSEKPDAVSLVPTCLSIEPELQDAKLGAALSQALSSYVSAAIDDSREPKSGALERPPESRRLEEKIGDKGGRLSEEIPAGAEEGSAEGCAENRNQTQSNAPTPVTPAVDGQSSSYIQSPFQSIAGSDTSSGKPMSQVSGFTDLLSSAPSGRDSQQCDTWGTSANLQSDTHLLEGRSMRSNSSFRLASHMRGTSHAEPQPAGSSDFGLWQGAKRGTSGHELGGMQVQPSVESSPSLLEAATSKAMLLQTAHLKEFLRSAKKSPSSEREGI